MRFTITINCNNSAFEYSPKDEIARILKEVCDKLENEEPMDVCPLKDFNGNLVGMAMLE
jgi:hypothetical protein